MSLGMNWLNFLRSLYHSNKRLFVIFLLVIAVLVIVGCTSGGSAPPPSGPIGGGCG